MQDFHSMMPGSSGRIFAASGDQRRLPGYPSPAAGTQPPIKCPRCDSSNTKFCYYNNYNLSQPRHFCKSCRRYWTKGGVLRNVPVGGGSRKSSSSSSSSSKRTSSSSSSKKSSSPSASAATAATATAAADKDRRRPQSSRSSSDNSSLTATDAAPLLSNHNPNPDRAPEPGGSVTELIPGAGFGFLDLAAGEIRVADPAAGMVDLGPRIGGGLINGLDWAAPVFDITGAVDQGAAYWNQSHWDDSDPSLYLP